MSEYGTPIDSMLNEFHGKNGRSTRSYWPQQKMFFEIFRLELKNARTWMEAARAAYKKSYRNHRFYEFLRWPKIWTRIQEIVLVEFEQAGLTREHVASGLKEAFDEGGPADRARIARLFYEIEGELGPKRNRRELPPGEAVDFIEAMQYALKGMPGGSPALVSDVSEGGVSGSDSPISSGDCNSPLGSSEETESDNCPQGIQQDYTEVS